MPLKTYTTKDEIPEKDRANSIEGKDGKWYVEEAAAVDTGLGDAGKAAIDRMKQERKDAIAAAKAAEQERDDLKAKLAVAEGRATDDGMKALRKEFEDREAKIKERADAAEAALRKTKRAERIRAYWLAPTAGGYAEREEKMLKDLDGRVDLNEGGDDLVILKDGKPSAVTAKDFFEKDYKKEAPFFYRGANGSGSGEQGGDGGSGSGTYDAAKAGKDAAAQQKAQTAGKELAFK